MPQNNEYDDFDDDEYMDGDAIQQVRKAHKAATKRIKELEAELTSLRTTARKSSVESVLTSKGFNPKIADLIPDTLVSADEITSWLDERSDVFQPTNAGSDMTPMEQMGNQEQMQPPPGARQFNEVVNFGQPPSGDESQILAMIQNAKTPEDLNRILFNNPHGPLAS